MSGPATSADDELRGRVLDLLVRIAPDIDPASLRADLEYRDQVEFDSMDLFNFAAAVHAELGIDVPEKDYRQLAALDRCVAYLLRRRSESTAPPAAP